MIEILPFSPLLRCAYCQANLSECQELEFEDWIVRCLECGAKNVIDVVIVDRPVVDVAVLGWRE